MNQREAKQHVCAVAAEELRRLDDTARSEFYEERDSCDQLLPDDRHKVAAAVDQLVNELTRRGRGR